MSSPTGPAPASHRYGARVLEASTLAEIAREIEATASDPEGVGIMTRKGRVYAIRLDGVPLTTAPLLKQEILSVGGDSAHARGIADHSVQVSAVVLLATWGQYQRLFPKLKRQPFHLKEIADEVDRALRAYAGPRTRRLAGVHRPLVVGDRPRVMGVVNVTPDSFYDGGAHATPAAAVDHAVRLAAEGADVIDVGGESTRPGAAEVTPEQEWARVGPVIAALHGRLEVPISIDTRHETVATQAIDAGADLVNDVSGLRSEAMRRVVARTGAPVVVMHMRGTPPTMQQDLAYADLRGEVYRELAAATGRAIADGVAPEKILVDPGLGFGKSADQSVELLYHVGELRSLGYPVVVGASRKSFLGALPGTPPAPERLEAGLAAAVIAAERGAALVRTHDVGPTVRALALLAAGDRLAAHRERGAEALAVERPDD
jgi:dihydropteroate synthase